MPLKLYIAVVLLITSTIVLSKGSPTATPIPTSSSSSSFLFGPSVPDYTTGDDLKNAYLNGQLNPDTYLPKGFYYVRAAHAIVGSLVWLILFPLGGVLARMKSNTRPHIMVQMAGLLLYLFVVGMGIWLAVHLKSMGSYHPMIGLVLLGLLLLQPLSEVLNHLLFARFPHAIWLAHMHLWLGRFLIVAGMIQGGTGFIFSQSFPWDMAPKAPRVAYGVVAIISALLYMILAIAWPELRSVWNPSQWWAAKKQKKEDKRTQLLAEKEEMRGARLASRPHKTSRIGSRAATFMSKV